MTYEQLQYCYFMLFGIGGIAVMTIVMIGSLLNAPWFQDDAVQLLFPLDP